jgi:beta-hydroxylase
MINGAGVLFDDTEPHEAWNLGPTDRVTLFLEVRRPARAATNLLNRATQALVATDRRFRSAPKRADEWDAAINPQSRPPPTDR